MGNSSAIVLGAVAFLLIVGFTILILVVALRGRSSGTIKPTDYDSDATIPNTAISRINWTENQRGFPSTVFPPGYEVSGEAKKIFTVLRGYNLERKYMTLLDVISIVLCQRLQLQSKGCQESFINDRLADLNTYGADANSQHAVAIVKSNTNLQNNKIGKLLVMSTDIIQKEMNNVHQDSNISKSDKEQISGNVSLFYRQNQDFVNKRCP
jgi:hypothetical protein